VRRAALLHAQQVEDVGERTRDLTSLPACDAPGDDPKGGQATVSRPSGAVRTTSVSLDREMISFGISKVMPRVISCGGKSPAKGTVRVHIEVGGDGRVANVSVQNTPDAELGACVAAAVLDASFARTVKGGSFSYPFGF